MRNPARAKFMALIIILLLAFAFPTSAQAQGIVYGDTVPAGTVVNHDVVLIGQNILLEGTVNGNVFILGNQVVVNGTVDGSLILLGQNAAIGGTVNGAVYVSALTLELTPGADLARELYVATVSLGSTAGSAVGRDLFALGLDAGLNGQIGGQMHTAIGPIQLYNGLMTLLGFDELTLKLRFDFSNPPAAPQSGNGNLSFLSAPHARLRLAGQQEGPFDWSAWGIERLREWLVLALFAVMALAFARPALERAGEPLGTRPIRTTSLGVLALVIVINLFGVGLLLAALIFSIGLGLNFIGLWQLSIALWIAAYSSLALILVGLWLFVVYGTKVIVVYQATKWARSRMPQINMWLNMLFVLTGLLAYVFLLAIPYVGWVFGVLVTAAGTGSAWLAYRAQPQTHLLPAPEAAVRVPALAVKRPGRKPAALK